MPILDGFSASKQIKTLIIKRRVRLFISYPLLLWELKVNINYKFSIQSFGYLIAD